MPTYGYQCTSCDNQFEIVQRITEDPLTKCDSCGGALRKKIFPVGIAFKGTGFYVNDYAAKPAKTGSAESPKAAPDTTSASTESKPAESATKTETPASPSAPAASTIDSPKPALPAAK